MPCGSPKKIVRNLRKVPSERRCPPQGDRQPDRDTRLPDRIEHREQIEVERDSATYRWVDGSTYVKNPPYFDGITMEPKPIADVKGARILARLGDSITTDHISPAGSIRKVSPHSKGRARLCLVAGRLRPAAARRSWLRPEQAPPQPQQPLFA